MEEPTEECDCGFDWSDCDDPCCYPANLTFADLNANNSALPCTWNQGPLCKATIAENFIKFGLLAPFLAFLLLAILCKLNVNRTYTYNDGQNGCCLVFPM